jgi:hypothetical protein
MKEEDGGWIQLRYVLYVAGTIVNVTMQRQDNNRIILKLVAQLHLCP